jgi:hypothetical protein
MTKVEFRLLQLILSPVSGDRTTLALLFWDGSRLRVVSALEFERVEPAHREGIRIAAEDFVSAAQKAARDLDEAATPRPDLGLAHIFPVREGYGASLYWAPIVTTQTGDADAYFDELVRELRLNRAEHALAECTSTQHGTCAPPSDAAPGPQGVPALTTSCASASLPA